MPFHNNGDSYLKKTKKIVVKKTQISLYNIYISSIRCTKTRATSFLKKKQLKMLINIVQFINFFRSLHL